MKKQGSILVAIDGSMQSIHAAKYISRICSLKKPRIVLMHVGRPVPEAFLDLRSTPGFGRQVIKASAWNIQQKKNIQDCMAKIQEIFYRDGYPKGNIEVKIQKQRLGIARDIIQEAQNDYNAVVVGRSGISKLKDVLLGSIAYKLADQIQQIPIVVVGGNPSPEKVLIAFDGSKDAYRGVDCVRKLMVQEEREVLLCHVIRSLNIYLDANTFFNEEQEDMWLASRREEVEKEFVKAEARLQKGGFTPERLSHITLENEASRAIAIQDIAREKGYGSIVLGRRGLTSVEEFLMGRVSRKVLHLAKKQAVWIV